MGYLSETFFLPVTFAERAAWSNGFPGDAVNIASFSLKQSLPGLQHQPPILPQASGRALTIGLIDHYRFSQECLLRALQSLNPSDAVIPYATLQDCTAADRADFDLIIYYSHEDGTPQATTLSNVAAIHSAYPAVPLVVLSDTENALQAETSREMLENGASSFIPTRTTSIFLTIGAIRFVKEGGKLDPPEKPAPGRRRADPPAAGSQPRLTSRETAVLRLMQRGKANKIIAHEMSLSENTVKIHVRNVMRKLDATNRTQAVDKARKLLGAPRETAAEGSERPAWCRRKSSDRRTERRHSRDGETEQ